MPVVGQVKGFRTISQRNLRRPRCSGPGGRGVLSSAASVPLGRSSVRRAARAASGPAKSPGELGEPDLRPAPRINGPSARACRPNRAVPGRRPTGRNRTLPCCSTAPRRRRWALPAILRDRQPRRPAHAAGSIETAAGGGHCRHTVPSPKASDSEPRRSRDRVRSARRGPSRSIRSRLRGQRMRGGQRQAVGQFGVVQDGPAAARPAHDRTAAAGGVVSRGRRTPESSPATASARPSGRTASSTPPCSADQSSSTSSTAMFHAPAAGRVDQKAAVGHGRTMLV